MIVTVTLNAAIDKRYQVQSLRCGAVNRVDTCRYSAGGKGLNVARVAALSGEEVTVTGFVGGHNGRLLEELAQRDGLRTEFVLTAGETRTCINIMDRKNGSQTELLEPGQQITAQELQRMEKTYGELLKQAELVTISGSVPAGVEAKTYAAMIQEAKKAGIPVLLDTSGVLLKECVNAAPTLIKPNQDEIEQLAGRKISREERKKLAVQLREKGIPYVAVSLGKDGSLLAAPSGIYEARVPSIPVVNTVGCGDSMLAGFAVGIKNGWEDEKILRFASAVSAANAMQEATGFYERADMEALYEKIQITKTEL